MSEALDKQTDFQIHRIQNMGLSELEWLHLILEGGSIIEWRRLHYTTQDEVDRLLQILQIDLTRSHDETWVRTILADAVEYLRKTFDYRVAEAVAHPKTIYDLFLLASGKINKKYKKIACIVLKVMHVIQHIEARELLFRIAVPEAQLAQMVIERVLAVLKTGQEKGLPIVEFSDSIKTRESMITKLIAKEDSTATLVYDRTRFRIIVNKRDDIVPILYFLTQHLLPFNFFVPAQTENTLIRFRDLVRELPNFRRYERQLRLDFDHKNQMLGLRNAFSGSTYKVLNFVVDLPIRLDAFLPPPEQDDRPRKGRITLATCEFQIADQATAEENERGENNHEAYKNRQRAVVLKRLSTGLVVPKQRST